MQGYLGAAAKVLSVGRQGLTTPDFEMSAGYRIRGEVRGAGDGRVAYVGVYALDSYGAKSVPTDASGQFEVTGLAEGDYRVSVARGGGLNREFDDELAGVVVSASDDVFVRLSLTETTVELAGRVVDGEDDPVEGAVVVAHFGISKTSPVGSDASGDFVLLVPAHFKTYLIAQDPFTGARGVVHADAATQGQTITVVLSP